MVMSDTLNQLDPTAKAMVEQRAREAGMSTWEWLTALILAANDPLRRTRSFSVGAAPTKSEIWQRESDPALHPFSDIRIGNSYLELKYREHTTDSLFSELAPLDDLAASAMHSIGAFSARINCAATLLSAAFESNETKDIRWPAARRAPRRTKPQDSWYAHVIEASVHRSREICAVLLYDWKPTGRAERLAVQAFVVLSDLTVAGNQLVMLCKQDRPRAFSELAKHLDLATRQFELSANLLTEIEGAVPAAGIAADRQFSDIRADLLKRAGGGLSLTEAAKLLGISRQALHKRIKAGTALGMMDGSELVLPRVQWVGHGDQLSFVPGLGDVLKFFATAGGWSALQFLIDQDPNLGGAPIQWLAEGKIAPVVAAAKAYLGVDEG